MNLLKVCFLLLYLTVQLKTAAQENYVLRDIRFKGNETISDAELLDQMTHYSTGWFSDVLLFEDPYLFSQEIFNRDKIRIVQYYQRNGFLHARINSVDFLSDSDDKTLEIEIEITENEPVKVNSVQFENKESALPAFFNELGTQVSLKKDEIFSETNLNDDKNLIINTAVNNGYPYASVDFDLQLDTVYNIVDIKWIINEGKYSRFGNVNFEGNERTEEELLLNKVKFKAGDEYSADKLDLTQKSIYDLGLFYIVSVKSGLDTNRDIIPISIRLEEAPKYNTKFGIGYGRDEKFRISLEQRILSFLGGARQLKIYAKHSALEPYHFRLDFLQPDFISEYTNLLVSPYLIKQTEPAFKLNKFGFDLVLQRPIIENIIGSLKYRFERSNLDTNSISKEELELYDLVSVYNKSGIELGLERNTAEPQFNPNEGSVTSAVMHYSGILLNSKYHFFRPTLEYRKYTQTTDWLVLAFRVKAGTIFSYDDDRFIPYEERFYSGGSSSVRGWGRAELGPKDKNGHPIGGKSVFESNIEFRYPIYSLISGVLFFDYGNVWRNELTYKFDDLRYSAGWGLRVATPIGPVRFDLAIPVFEGSAKLQYMISVGQAF